MQKTYLNASLSGIGFATFLGSVVMRTLEMAALVETALWLHGLTDQASGLHINWVAINFDVFCVCAAGLIFINFDAGRRAFGKWQKSRTPLFMSAYNAVMWLCYWTLLGNAWPADGKPEQALKAMEQLGASGKLTFMGCAAGGHDLKTMSPGEFRNSHLEVYRSGEHDSALALVSDNDRRIFTGLAVNQAQVKKLWAPSGRNGNFAGWVY